MVAAAVDTDPWYKAGLTEYVDKSPAMIEHASQYERYAYALSKLWTATADGGYTPRHLQMHQHHSR